VENKSELKERRKLSIPRAAIIIIPVLALGLEGLYYLNRAANRPPAPPPPLSGAARAYVKNGFLPITNVDMQAHESYLKQSIVEITGNIGNTGDRVISSAVIYCVFYDPYDQVVLRERVPIVKSRLAPGETKPFRLAFDNVPEGWNQIMPQLVIAAIDFS
jgi:hypothetical protein